jgi:2-isopropylmalate synthase
MLKNPATKYRQFPVVNLSQRSWVNKTITHPPMWLSTDLRDGNQALIEPMNPQQKLRLFQLLVSIGFQEIEVAFPSASQADFDFVRYLIENQLIPDDVTIQVLTQAREDLIRRTFAALQGAKNVIVHVYNATSPVFRRTVFGLDRLGTINLAVSATKLIKQLTEESISQQRDSNWRFQYSPETFTATELDFAKDICDAVLDVWQPTPQQKAIINLPATVEVSTPNVFADQVEWMHNNLNNRDSLILCVHPHNDRGCGVAAAELAQMAGAERVEGCLFGNGERTGNVDLVTLALNLYTQGINPGLDFSNINEVARIAEDCTQLPIHPRHPYAGDLVFTSFSGSHQDAIKKGFAVQKSDNFWEIPYLPLDPRDVGRSYESIVRVNSQSGKGGIAYLLERDYDLVLPRRLQIEFSQVVQRQMDTTGKEMSAADLYELFQAEYLHQFSTESIKYISYKLLYSLDGDDFQGISVTLEVRGEVMIFRGKGNGPIDAFVNALDMGIKIYHYEERGRHTISDNSIHNGSQDDAICFVEITTDSNSATLYGVGIHPNIVTASILSIVSAVNRVKG